MILVATGSLVGEGFDFPRLDTLIMATPVSFRSVIEQYAGRLKPGLSGKAAGHYLRLYRQSYPDVSENVYEAFEGIQADWI